MNDAVPPPVPAWPPGFVPAEGFDTDAANRATADLKTVDVWDLETTLLQAVPDDAATEARGDDARRWLAGLCSLSLRPAEKANAWGPRRIVGQYRSPALQDVTVEQAQALAALAPKLEHPGLRARVADVAWSVDRRNGRAAGIAIDAYIECAERLDRRRAHPRFDRPGRASLEALGYVERSLYLGYRTRKRGQQPERVVAALERVYAAARRERQFVVFVNAARLGLYYELLDRTEVAADAERLATRARLADYPVAVKQVLDLAVELYDGLEDAEGRRRCQLASVKRTLQMRKQVSGPGAEAHWVQSALFELRHIPNTEDLRRRLRREMRDLQEDALGLFTSHAIPLDLGDERDEALRSFDRLDLPTALKELACISQSRPIAELRAQALQTLDVAPLSAMMAVAYSDQDGRTRATSPGASTTETPSEDWFKAQYSGHEQIRRQIIQFARFEPAREALNARFDLGERHLMPIVAQSPFVRLEQRGLMTLGFTHLLRGDYRSAVHVLIPQLEPCLRYVLRCAGHDPTVDFDDMTEEDVGLPAMLGRFRTELERILPPQTVLEIELLFNHRPGPAVRHAVAHGAIGAGGCFSPDAVFACWLLYQLTAWPLLRHWDARIAPEILAAL